MSAAPASRPWSNLNAWNSLPDDLKAIVEAAAYKLQHVDAFRV